MNSVYVSEVVDCSGVTGLKPTNTYTPQTTAVNCFLITALFLSHFFNMSKIIRKLQRVVKSCTVAHEPWFEKIKRVLV